MDLFFVTEKEHSSKVGIENLKPGQKIKVTVKSEGEK